MRWCWIDVFLLCFIGPRGGTERHLCVDIEVGPPESETPAQQKDRLREESHAEALENMNSDEHVKQLIEKFSGHLDETSVASRANRR